jgi:nitrite reductase/ring-hydroxylating ferredoxin subunit
MHNSSENQVWLKASTLELCPPGSCQEVLVSDRIVALFNVQGTIYALDGVCPHQGGPLGQGTLAGSVVTCPWHGWQFDVRSGQHLVHPLVRQPGLPVRVEGNTIWVQVKSDQEFKTRPQGPTDS